MFYRTSLLVAVVVSGILGAPEATAAVSLESFACSRAIELDSDGNALEESTLVSVPIAEDMYRWLNSRLSDVVVFDDKGNPIATKVIGSSSTELKEYSLPDDAIKMELDKQKGQTVITLDVQRLPISKIQFHTEDRNFQREVEVVVPASGSEPQRVLQREEIQRIDLKGLRKEQLSLVLQSVRPDRLQLRIFHGENRPIEIQKVQLFGPTHECRFIAEPGRNYTLAYGSKSVDGIRQLDAAALEAASQRGLEPIEARLSETIVLRKSTEPEVEYSLDEVWANPWFIYPVVILLVVLLGLGLVHAARRLSVVEEQEENDPV